MGSAFHLFGKAAAKFNPITAANGTPATIPRRLSRQLAAQLLGKFFHALEFFDYVFREQAVIGAVYVGGDGRRNVGEFLGCVLEPDHVHWSSLLSLQ